MIRNRLPINNYNPPSINQLITEINQTAEIRRNIVTETGVSRTLTDSDTNKYLRFTNASSITVTVEPEDSGSHVWQEGDTINLYQSNSGGITVAEATGVTVNGATATNNVGETIELTYVGSDTWEASIREENETAAQIEAALDNYFGNTNWRTRDYGLKGIESFSASSDLLLAWANEYVRGTSGSATNVTVQPVSTIAHVVNTVITINQSGAGQITLVAGTGVTLNVPSSEGLKTEEQHKDIQLIYVGSNVWDVKGGVA